MYFILDFRSLCRSFSRKKMKLHKKSLGKFTREDMHAGKFTRADIHAGKFTRADMHGFHFSKYCSAIYGEMIHIFSHF